MALAHRFRDNGCSLVRIRHARHHRLVGVGDAAAHWVMTAGLYLIWIAAGLTLITGYDYLLQHDWDHNASKTLPGPDRQLNAGFWESEKPGGEPRIERYLRNAKVSAVASVSTTDATNFSVTR